MAFLGDVVVQFPLSGSQPGPTFIRVMEQCASSSFSSVYHPGGSMLTGTMLAAANPNRRGLIFYNSGALTANTTWGRAGTYLEVGSRVAANANFQQFSQWPVYTGPLYLCWIGSGTLSSSVAYVTEFSV